MINLLIALNQKEEMISANYDTYREDFFYCPSCRGRVFLKVGHIKRPHFAHYRNQDCQSFSEGETQEHLEGKLQLATYLKTKETNVQLEAYLPELQQRPDILFEKENRQIVIEFQCSSISIESIAERTAGYLKANYEVIWILGNNFNYTKKLTAFHKACLYSTMDKHQPLLIHYDAYSESLLVRYDFQILNNGQMSNQLKQMNLSEKKSIKLTGQTRISRSEKSVNEIYRRHERLMREVRCPRPELKSFLELIYLKKENIVSIPRELYYYLPSEWMIQTYPMHWKYQFLLWIEKFTRKHILTMKMLKRWINEQISKKLIVYYKSPQLTEIMCLQPFLEWIELLEERKILKRIGYLKWSYQRPLARYKTLEEKFELNF